jgi:short-subunit dehydrogenase
MRTTPTTRTALVTGAGAGTGREYVRLLLADNVNVLAVSLLNDELASLQSELDPGGERLIVKQADLCEPDSAEKLLAWCDEHGYQVDILINNAGFAAYGAPTDIDLVKLERMLMLNVVTSTKISMIFGARMKERGSGRILVMGSSAGYSPTVRFAAYGASKAYTNTFTLALGADLEKSGVTVTLVAPGSFQSNFAATADVSGFQGSSVMKRIYATERLDAPAVARAGYRALAADKSMVTVGSKGLAAKVLARALSPVFMARRSRIL